MELTERSSAALDIEQSVPLTSEIAWTDLPALPRPRLMAALPNRAAWLRQWGRQGRVPTRRRLPPERDCLRTLPQGGRERCRAMGCCWVRLGPEAQDEYCATPRPVLPRATEGSCGARRALPAALNGTRRDVAASRLQCLCERGFDWRLLDGTVTMRASAGPVW